MSAQNTDPAQQISIEYGNIASPEGIAALKSNIDALPEALSSLGITLSKTPEGARYYCYDKNTGLGEYDEYKGTVDPEAVKGPVFTAKKTHISADNIDYFYWKKWAKEITFTEDGGMLVTESKFGPNEKGYSDTVVVSKDTHPASQQDVEELSEFVAGLPDALKKFEDDAAAYKTAREAQAHNPKRSKAGKMLSRLGLSRR